MPHPVSPEVHKIHAAVLRKNGGQLKIESLELEGPREDEVLVRLVATGICHTDISFCDGWNEAPVVLGHEGAGVVEEVGKSLTTVKRGDHVVLSYQSCGQCSECRRGHPTGCECFWEANFGFARLDGSNALARSGVRGHFFGQSSFATHALATERNLVKVSQDLPLGSPGAARLWPANGGRHRAELSTAPEGGQSGRFRHRRGRPGGDHGSSPGRRRPHHRRRP